MVIRPTERWRESPEYPPREFIAQVDDALGLFESELAALAGLTDAEVVDVVERAVRALNHIDQEFGPVISTIEREDLGDYFDDVLVEAGIDVRALEARLGVHGITDRWRDW